MRLSWEYIAGFFDGEGHVATMNFTHRDGLAATMVTIGQSGKEGLQILTRIQEFIAEHGVKGYVGKKAQVREHYRPMHYLRIASRPSVQAFLSHIFPFVSVKKVVVQDTLRFMKVFPSIRGAVTIERNKARGKQGVIGLDADVLRAELAAGARRKDLAAKYNCTTYTIKKYLDHSYRERYDAYRKQWREKRRAASAAVAVA